MATEPIPAAVIGAGSYGTCLAFLLASAGHDVVLWARGEAFAAELEATRENKLYLPGFQLPPAVHVTSDLERAVSGKPIVMGVTPSHAIRDVFGRAAGWLDPDAVMVNASKGLEDGTLLTIDEVYRQILPARIAARATFLSGPTFAAEIAAGMPSAIVLAGRDPETTQLVQRAISTDRFRTYSSDDVTGVLVGGAIKNVVAIAAGVSDGLGFGSNARAALITRGLAEITRIGVTMGARAETFAGLSGMGDLVLTCSSDTSRNRKVGLALGQGKTMAEILGDMRMVAEGVKTTKVAHELALKLGVPAPITDVMHAIVHEGAPARETMQRLMQRALRSERG
ncbi:MAG: NAD(P)-dependent glycerol-3-phosphate dehydrogenase [Kofleriaceae bacterium]|nr:MAG: NAD(P)-dependent glycerol-3-phosphate dehydrogenase [Kofleriaceae bacterium]MBZ0230817.1 NAD(P)-dependent glycerol-3-phosphate dehydrogenase [Kofleriaceae bacterium]